MGLILAASLQKRGWGTLVIEVPDRTNVGLSHYESELESEVHTAHV